MVVKIKLVNIVGYNGFVMTSEDSRFKDAYGAFIKTNARILCANMHEISRWCKNTFGEKCMFEVED